MVSFSLGFQIEGFSEIEEQIKSLTDVYGSLVRGFCPNDSEVLRIGVDFHLGIQKTENGPKICLDVENQSRAVAFLTEQKEKIDKLLSGIDALAVTAAEMEQELNHPNSSAVLCQ